MDGIFLLNKPKNITSAKFLDSIKGGNKMGHAGTLDPFAEGLLIVGVGKSTKLLSNYIKLDKEYIGKICLGYKTNTYDVTGEKIFVSDRIPEIIEIENLLKKMVGSQEQIPPSFSAKKINGVRSYKLARTNKPTVLKPCNITIYSLEILEYNYPYLSIKTLVSSGTYIRSIANDIGEELGIGGYLSELCRTKIGEYKLEDSRNFILDSYNI
jgi:tRNA pseudouridine55 synthase